MYYAGACMKLKVILHCKNWVVGITTLRLLAHWFKFDNPKVVTQ